MIQLGRTMKDKITGFTGVATANCIYLSGCSQVLLAPSAVDNKFASSEWFDEQRCETVGDSLISLDNGDTPGPDRAAPKR